MSIYWIKFERLFVRRTCSEENLFVQCNEQVLSLNEVENKTGLEGIASAKFSPDVDLTELQIIFAPKLSIGWNCKHETGYSLYVFGQCR
jgi:hypothetical protein